jgi:hypothetical protein
MYCFSGDNDVFVDRETQDLLDQSLGLSFSKVFIGVGYVCMCL